MHTHLKRLTAAFVLAIAAMTTLPSVADAKTASGPSMAEFEGHTIDLRRGWGEAKACATDGEHTRCFRSEDAMNNYMSEQRSASSGTFGTLSSCGSPVRLYDNTGFGSPVLNLYSRGTWLNLSAYGFDARAASYIIGACAAYFADGTSGGGTWYPGNTGAYASNPDMGASWRDRVSSVYLT
jgi:hypothetical protein